MAACPSICTPAISDQVQVSLWIVTAAADCRARFWLWRLVAEESHTRRNSGSAAKNRLVAIGRPPGATVERLRVEWTARNAPMAARASWSLTGVQERPLR